MSHRKRHTTVGVPVGPVQVGGGAPGRRPVDVEHRHRGRRLAPRSSASSSPRRAPRWCASPSTSPKPPRPCPRSSSGCSTPGSTAPLIGDFHYNGHVLLTKFPDCARALDKYRINPGNVGKGARRDEQFATICHIARDNAKPVRIGVNGGSLNQELVMEKMQENTDRDLGKTLRGDHQRVHGPLGPAVDRARAAVGPAQGPDHHLVQGLAAARPDRRLPRARDAHRPAAAPRADRGRHGDEGPRLVLLRDGRAPERGHRRHDPHLAHAAPGRRPPRGGLRRVRAAPVARHPLLLAERHRVPRLRPHDLDDLPGARRAHPGLHPRPDADRGRRSTTASRT